MSPEQEQQFKSLTLVLHKNSFCVIKLPANSDINGWDLPPRYNRTFFSVSFCEDEISIVCEEIQLDQIELDRSAEIERGWTLLQVSGQLEFEMVGVIAGFSRLFASAGIPIFCFSTFNTDYFLIKTTRIQEAIEILNLHEIQWCNANA